MPTATHAHRPAHVLRSQTIFPPHSPSRPMPTRSATYPSEKSEAPWQHMAHTYTWVIGQEFLAHDKRDRKTEQWILEQQIFLAADSGERRSARRLGSQRKMWEEMVYSYEIEAERWMRHEEDTRRRAAEREREKTRLIQEELRRVEARIRYKREAERRKIAEEKARIYEELRERERRNQVKADKMMMDAWNDYEKRWSDLPTSSESLAFASIPWPVVSPPLQAEDLTKMAISSFLYSPLHSQSQTRKDRIRSAQLRWHPDRFQRVLGKVKEEEKAQVEEGVGIVARCLNDMMARETAIARQNWPYALDSATKPPTTKAPSEPSPFSPEPSHPTPNHSEYPTSPELTIEDSQPSDIKTESSDPEEKPSSDPPSDAEGEHSHDAGSGGAFNPVTGEINWDCPCLGEEEPKGINCVEKFKSMQTCFREHPEVYGDEIMDDEEDEEPAPAPAEGALLASDSSDKLEGQSDSHDLSPPPEPEKTKLKKQPRLPQEESSPSVTP
ncbi:Mitochondrial intermembrane space import and assembly protein 40 [Hypsizygus marmoreus]|uniref:Mitochondrial intermembrane space import and assembly protein 40 n=1 Tax=Hypsizygus marmoreus TaxID=39966 RepID=A0A369JY01_HYPMA|nr:Mitochondrial intermembrane space import and assembly protein 40 [Hypsizygus marmoreus]